MFKKLLSFEGGFCILDTLSFSDKISIVLSRTYVDLLKV